MSKDVKISLPEPYLSSRQVAADLRRVAEGYIKNGHKVIFDLTSVRSLSSSFADELFGILYLKLTGNFKNQVSFRIQKRDENKLDVLRSISDAIDSREKDLKLTR